MSTCSGSTPLWKRHAVTTRTRAEISGVGLNDIRTLARWYKEASPAVIAWGTDSSAIRTVAPGSVPSPLYQRWQVNLAWRAVALSCAGHAFPKTLDKLTRAISAAADQDDHILDVGRLLLDDNLNPPIKALFIYNHNR